MRILLFVLFYIGLIINVVGQGNYWILLEGKGDLSVYQPEEILSSKALERRAKQGIELDFYDYPVNKAYLQDLRQKGIATRYPSRWINAVSAELFPDQKAEVLALPYVKGIKSVTGVQHTAEITEECDVAETEDDPARQLKMVGLDQLHRNQLTGKGITIAVFDNGFLGVDELDAFAHIFEEERLIATRDFVDGDDNVFEPCSHCKHGTNVLSILAARLPGQLIGSAPEANYILLRTENDASETHQEEENWVAAAEYADSLGANIFTTSLGYRFFDPGEGDYVKADLDGNTAIITRASDRAAAKGIVVVNSAGNNGSGGINAPADGDSVIAIGGVNKCEEYVPFSSQGLTADGRIKPDVTAMGERVFILTPDGDLRVGDGTSFSCPIISGLAACLLQSRPTATNMELYDALIQSADRFNEPDKFYGYGIPNGVGAFDLLNKGEKTLEEFADSEGYGDRDMIVYPNPSEGNFYLSFVDGLVSLDAEVSVYDMTGRRVFHADELFSKSHSQMGIQLQVSPGIYSIRVLDKTDSKISYTSKIFILEP